MNKIYSDLSAYIKTTNSNGSLLLFKSKEESTFLKEWITSKNEISKIIKPDAVDESISGIVSGCNKCKSALNKKHGTGSGKNRIMIILNSPADISKIERENLREESVDLLKKMLSAIKVELKECYVTNLIKCETEGIIKPGEMLKNCEPILLREITEYNPEIAIVMGDNIPIKKIMNDRKNISWYTVNHPLTLIKKNELKKPAWIILQNIMARLDENRARGN